MIKTVREIVPATEITTLLGCDAKFVQSERIIHMLSDDCRVHTHTDLFLLSSSPSPWDFL